MHTLTALLCRLEVKTDQTEANFRKFKEQKEKKERKEKAERAAKEEKARRAAQKKAAKDAGGKSDSVRTDTIYRCQRSSYPSCVLIDAKYLRMSSSLRRCYRYAFRAVKHFRKHRHVWNEQ